MSSEEEEQTPKKSVRISTPSPMTVSVRRPQTAVGRARKPEEKGGPVMKDRPVSAPARLKDVIIGPASGPPSANLPPPLPSTAHRRYTPVRPVANTALAKKWDDDTMKRHLKKLASIKPCVDNKMDFTLSHERKRARMLIKERFITDKIEKENEKMVKKLIRQRSKTMGISNLDDRKHIKDLPTKSPRSQSKREHELHQIEKENEFLYLRVETQRPLYNTRKWDMDFIRTLGYMTNISRFPEGYNDLLKKEGLIKRKFVTRSASPRTNKSQQLKLLQKSQEKKPETPKQNLRPKSAPARPKVASKPKVVEETNDSDISSISDWGETFKNAPIAGGEMGRTSRPKSAMYRS